MYARGRVQQFGFLRVDAAKHETRVTSRLKVDQVSVISVHLDILKTNNKNIYSRAPDKVRILNSIMHNSSPYPMFDQLLELSH